MPRRLSPPVPQWTDPRHQLGFDGEALALAFLQAAGWIVLAHRFRLGHNEIDLVVRRGALVAFVEVKTRRSRAFGDGREAIGWKKRRAIGRVAELWRLRHGAPGDSYRFDVVEVVPRRGEPPEIRHLEDAWRLERR